MTLGVVWRRHDFKQKGDDVGALFGHGQGECVSSLRLPDLHALFDEIGYDFDVGCVYSPEKEVTSTFVKKVRALGCHEGFDLVEFASIYISKQINDGTIYVLGTGCLQDRPAVQCIEFRYHERGPSKGVGQVGIRTPFDESLNHRRIIFHDFLGEECLVFDQQIQVCTRFQHHPEKGPVIPDCSKQ